MTAHQKKILDHIWKTYKSRYNAHHRLHRIAALEVVTTTSISILILGVNLIGIIPNLAPQSLLVGWINFYSIVMSVVVITLTVYHGRSQTTVRAERALVCALDLQHLYEKAKTRSDENDTAPIPNLEDDYHQILKSFPDNHHPLDYQRTYLHENENKKKCVKLFFRFFWFHVKCFFTFYLIHVSLLVFSVVTAVALFLLK